MDTVQHIEARTAKALAEQKVAEVVAMIASGFECDESWVKVWVPQFRNALVGDRAKPEFTAAQIGHAYDAMMQSYRWQKPPKPANMVEKARELRPLTPMQKRHTDPTPGRKWTDAERAANIAWIDAKNAFIDEQNRDPEYAEALMTHGKGSPELKAVVDRQRAEMQAWLRH